MIKKIALISLSNGLSLDKKHVIDNMIKKLATVNIDVYTSKTIYADENGLTSEPAIRAMELMKIYQDPEIQAVFDISGGDLANQVIPYIDFKVIKENMKPFFGYSDLSVILNSLYKKTGIESFWFQLRSILYNDDTFKLLTDYLLKEDYTIFKFNYKYLQGEKMSGTVIGGNLRCSLKIAGTDYAMDFENKLLLIESMGGDLNKTATYLTQYKMMGAFEKVNGVILGTFIELENNYPKSEIESLILKIIDNKNLPVIKTQDIGHNSNSKIIAVGRNYSL